MSTSRTRQGSARGSQKRPQRSQNPTNPRDPGYYLVNRPPKIQPVEELSVRRNGPNALVAIHDNEVEVRQSDHAISLKDMYACVPKKARNDITWEVLSVVTKTEGGDRFWTSLKDARVCAGRLRLTELFRHVFDLDFSKLDGKSSPEEPSQVAEQTPALGETGKEQEPSDDDEDFNLEGEIIELKRRKVDPEEFSRLHKLARKRLRKVQAKARAERQEKGQHKRIKLEEATEEEEVAPALDEFKDIADMDVLELNEDAVCTVQNLERDYRDDLSFHLWSSWLMRKRSLLVSDLPFPLPNWGRWPLPYAKIPKNDHLYVDENNIGGAPLPPAIMLDPPDILPRDPDFLTKINRVGYRDFVFDDGDGPDEANTSCSGEEEGQINFKEESEDDFEIADYDEIKQFIDPNPTDHVEGMGVQDDENMDEVEIKLPTAEECEAFYTEGCNELHIGLQSAFQRIVYERIHNSDRGPGHIHVTKRYEIEPVVDPSVIFPLQSEDKVKGMIDEILTDISRTKSVTSRGHALKMDIDWLKVLGTKYANVGKTHDRLMRLFINEGDAQKADEPTHVDKHTASLLMRPDYLTPFDGNLYQNRRGNPTFECSDASFIYHPREKRDYPHRAKPQEYQAPALSRARKMKDRDSFVLKLRYLQPPRVWSWNLINQNSVQLCPLKSAGLTARQYKMWHRYGAHYNKFSEGNCGKLGDKIDAKGKTFAL